jgi:Flp pilus assembly protein TadD
MKKIDVNFLEPSQQQLNSLLELYQTGRYEDVEKLSLSITQEFPKHPFAWKVLGSILKQTGRISDSLVVCQKSTHLDPQDAEAHNNLAVLLQELERLNEAEASLRQAITLKPD